MPRLGFRHFLEGNRMAQPKIGMVVKFRPHYEEKLAVNDDGMALGEIVHIHYEGERYHSVNLIVTDAKGGRHDRHSIRLLKNPPGSQDVRPFAIIPGNDVAEVPTPPETPTFGGAADPGTASAPILEPSSDPAAEHVVDPPATTEPEPGTAAPAPANAETSPVDSPA